MAGSVCLLRPARQAGNGHKLGNTCNFCFRVLCLQVAVVSLIVFILYKQKKQGSIMWLLKVDDDLADRPATLLVPTGYCLQHVWRDSSGWLVVRFSRHSSPPRETPTLQEPTAHLTPPPLDPEIFSPDVLGPEFTVFKNAQSPQV